MSGADRVALEAHTGQVLADLGQARREGRAVRDYVLPCARTLAGRLREEFPGRDQDSARVLASASSSLSGLGDLLAECGTPEKLIAPVLLEVLGFTAAELDDATPGNPGQGGEQR